MNAFSERTEVIIEELDLGEKNVIGEGSPEISNVFETTVPASNRPTVYAKPTADSAVSTKTTSVWKSARDEFYANIPPEDAEYLRHSACVIRAFERKFVVKIGETLVTIRKKHPGQFVHWLKVEFDMSVGSAYNYIGVWEKFGTTPQVIDVLPVRTVYKLAAKGTPSQVRDAVVSEIVSGDKPTAQEVERRIAEAREAEKERLAAERKQAEAQRKKQAAERVWEARLEELKDAGKTEGEIERERKAFLSKEERGKRDRLKREEEARQQQRKSEEVRDAKRQGALAAANFLRSRLGSDFETFQSMMAEVGLHEIERAIKELSLVELPAQARTDVTKGIELDKAA